MYEEFRAVNGVLRYGNEVLASSNSLIISFENGLIRIMIPDITIDEDRWYKFNQKPAPNLMVECFVGNKRVILERAVISKGPTTTINNKGIRIGGEVILFAISLTIFYY